MHRRSAANVAYVYCTAPLPGGRPRILSSTQLLNKILLKDFSMCLADTLKLTASLVSEAAALARSSTSRRPSRTKLKQCFCQHCSNALHLPLLALHLLREISEDTSGGPGDRPSHALMHVASFVHM